MINYHLICVIVLFNIFLPNEGITSEISAPFGEKIGIYKRTVAYSNGDHSFVSEEHHDLEYLATSFSLEPQCSDMEENATKENMICLSFDGELTPADFNPSNNDSCVKFVYTGMKWQCVEFARRWLIENKKYTFDSVPYAYNMWDLHTAQSVSIRQSDAPFLHCLNNESSMAPALGDLLIYSTENTPITGHVSVIVFVDIDNIYIAEQNYVNSYWNEVWYSRKIPYKKRLNANNIPCFSIEEVGLIGWMKIL